MSENQTSDSLREWRESAPYWEKHSDTIRSMFAPLTEALIEEASITPGKSVLDVAGGAGEPSLTMAERIGPLGCVTYTDGVAEMVAAAKREAHRRGVTNIKFHQTLANALPFANNSFDAVVSRLGVMFFLDPLGALREMVRVTKPGGMLSFAVWHKSELNPFAHVVTEVVSRYIPTPPGDPNAPGAFRFAELGVLAQILKDAGATEVRERVLHYKIEAPISPGEFWEMRSGTSGTLREKLAYLSAEQALRIAQEIENAVRPYFLNDHMSFPAQAIIVAGGKTQAKGRSR